MIWWEGRKVVEGAKRPRPGEARNSRGGKALARVLPKERELSLAVEGRGGRPRPSRSAGDDDFEE